MSNKIVIALRRRYHCEHTRMVLQQNDLHYPVYELSETDTSFELLHRIIDRGARILITGDVYASTLLDELDISVVTIRRSKIPFETAIQEAFQKGSRIAIIWRDTDSAVAQQICQAYAPAVTFFPYHDWSVEYASLLPKLKEQDVQVVIGPPAISPQVLGQGLQIVHVPYDESDILAAVRLAEHNLTYLEERQQHIEMMRSIQDNISEGIVSLSPDGKIQMVNRAAADILHLDPRTLTGLPLAQTDLSCPETAELLRTFEPFSSKVLLINGISVAMDGRPVFVHHIFKSAILTLTPVEQLRRSEQLVRTRLNARTGASVTFSDIVGNSPPIVQAIRTAQQYARVDSPVLVYGQSGTGKEMFVQSIHNASSRRKGPFVVINCAALPESLIESELFGYVKGAFTGALSSGKQGLFERGHQGTVFLDEVSEMPLHVQARFLRVLQEREVTPIGSQQPISVDIRIVAATNRDLQEMVQQKLFREDLYYRISVLTMTLPPLCERGSDTGLLIRHFLKTKNDALNLNIKGIQPDALRYLQSLSYPGNIRQLSNIVERAMVLCEGDVLDLPAAVQATTHHADTHSPELPPANEAAIDTLRKESLLYTLQQNSWNRAKTAKELGISTSTLYRRMKALGICEPSK